jgi:large subunit ribosomal protein L20
MRVKRGVTTHQRHKKIRKATKGFTKGNRTSVKRGNQAVTKSLQYAYGTTYSRLIAGLKTSQITIDRKILAELAVNEPAAFKAVLDAANKKNN